MGKKFKCLIFDWCHLFKKNFYFFFSAMEQIQLTEQIAMVNILIWTFKWFLEISVF